MDDAVADLLDRFWQTHVELDDQTPLWDSDVTQLERWPSASVARSDELRRRMGALRDEAERLAEVHAAQRPSLLTVAGAAALLAARADTDVELAYAHPHLGLHSYLFWAVNGFALRTAEHGQRYLTKLAAFPAAVDELRERLVVATEAGRPMLARHAAEAADLLEQHVAAPAADSPLLVQPAPTELDPAAAERWRTELQDAVVTHVRPALERLAATLRTVVEPAGRGDAACGMVHVPGGEAAYAELLAGYTAPGTTARQVHETGLAQVARLEQEYRRLGRSAFGTDDLEEVMGRLRDDPSLRHDTAVGVVAAATELHARATVEAPRWFAHTPVAPCEIRATDHGAIAFYSAPPRDGARGGVFFFNTSEPAVWGPDLAATVFHEGIPGHHFQGALAVESDHLHDLHRQLFLPAFGEGWALYAEQLAEEMGLYRTDVERLGRLTTDSMRACRLVVDTGMHAFGWSRDRAIAFVSQHTPLHRTAVEREIDRYIGTPAQATSYMIGRLEIQRLREAAAARLGDGFDVRDFHDVVLSRGMVSLPALTAMVEAWDGGPAPRG